MKSVKNHLSLIVALMSILFSIQVFIIVERSIDAYKENLAKNYSVVVVSEKHISQSEFLSIDGLIKKAKELSPDSVIKRLNTGMSEKNIDLLRLTLPKFYKLYLTKFPSPKEIKTLRKNLFLNESITKIEDFSNNHDITYKLLVLFKGVISVFAVVVSIVTMLLIVKELRIWQFKHSERMNIMGLFGAPTWLRSAVLFRLSIVDAIISSILIFLLFLYLSTNKFVLEQFQNININIVIFDRVNDFLLLLGVSLALSVLLATMIVLGHKEEV
ncbi:cell division protein FtsX [Sulfurimonas lithotrophica]|uniref:Cell division protein FtsX n=1 Tax=Sulfurimonas lithotrophica TaxID=2590022 RepID=A0A5P8P1L0_9BACT|nr:cell division protein FtsX [Sulfurimonas lithotrophica]QFR49623.1 cell division protein FtsX [Sulfurimonas lithotrophica]